MRCCLQLIGCFFYLLSITANSYSQAISCPPNIDFKAGDFSNWLCRSGFVATSGGLNFLTWSTIGPTPNRHELIAPTNTDIDPYGGFPKQCPSSTSYSVKLGNNLGGHEAEGLFYTFTIPANATKFSLLYNYAIVLQNPGHRTDEQPRFRARIIDAEDFTEVNCVSFDFTASGSLPGFRPTLIGNGVYKDWTPISVDLSAYAGKTITIEFISSDCTFQEHFGYAYINVSSVCNGSVEGSKYCEGDSITTLTAPHGYQSYQWFSDTSFAQPLIASQNLTLNVNSTPPGSVLPVVVLPFPGYGCVDTLYAEIGQAQKPVGIAGIDGISCSKQPLRLGTSNNNNYSYYWTPEPLVSNHTISNPFIAFGLQSVTEYIVRTTDLETGCFSLDTVVITPVVIDTASNVSGETIYCPGEPLTALLSIGNTSATVQWFNGNNAISGATGFTYRPSTVGNYWAELKQSGCIDTSQQFVLKQAPLPKPNFTLNKEIQCLNEPIVFTNKTTIGGNDPVNYTWRFGDGGLFQSVNAEKNFSAAGNYTITLIAKSGTDCVDSIEKQIMIVNDCLPILPTAFTPNGDGKNDDLKPFLVGAKALKRFTVYNRWGNVVFSTTKEGDGWNGSYKKAPLQTDVFVWIVEYVTKDNRVVTQKGTVTLIR